MVYDIIVGVGRIGMQLAKFLSNSGHEVVIIEENKEKCEAIASEIDALIINGDGTAIATLKNAGVERADNFIAVTESEEVNLLACLLAKRLGAKRTITRIADPAKEEVFKNIGLDAVVNPEVAAAIYLEKLIMRPGVLDLVVLGRGNAEILEIVVGPKMAGKKVKDVKTKNYTIVAIVEDSTVTIPDEDRTLKTGDRILVLAITKSVSELEKLFGKITK